MLRKEEMNEMSVESNRMVRWRGEERMEERPGGSSTRECFAVIDDAICTGV